MRDQTLNYKLRFQKILNEVETHLLRIDNDKL